MNVEGQQEIFPDISNPYQGHPANSCAFETLIRRMRTFVFFIAISFHGDLKFRNNF